MKLKRNICVLFVVLLSAFQFTGCEFEGSGYGTANVPPIVEQWRSLVEHYAEEYGIPEYVDLILAMIMQESGGNAEQTPDIMQCSESAGMSPNAIDDPEVSIRQGVKYLASLVRSGEAAGVDRATVIQSYNFGGGYISFIAENGGKHSEELARQYSASMASRYGLAGKQKQGSTALPCRKKYTRLPESQFPGMRRPSIMPVNIYRKAKPDRGI